MSEKLRWCLSKFPALEVAAASAGRYPIGGSDGGRGGLDGGDSHGISTEEHYMKMVEENPGNPLLSRNYAEFLYQTKKDAKKAEEYYSRAILADPAMQKKPPAILNGRFRPPEETVMLKLHTLVFCGRRKKMMEFICHPQSPINNDQMASAFAC